MIVAPLLVCFVIQPAAQEPIRLPRLSELIELFVDRDPEVVKLKEKVHDAETHLDRCQRNLFDNDPVVARAKAELRYIKGVWERRRTKVRAAVFEILQEPNGMDILLKLCGDKR